MALSVRPQFNTWDREGQARSTLEAQFGFGQAVAENWVAGVLSSFGLGTALREAMTPQPVREYDPNAPLWTIPNPFSDAAKTAGAIGAVIRGDKPEPAMTEEEFAASPDWRKQIPYEPGMTKSRLAALAAQYDVAEARAMMSQKEWGGAFIGQFLGQMLDPINYVPFTGPAVQTAAVARAGGILGRIGVAATDAAISTAVFGAATAEWRRKFGDDISFEAMAQEIGMSMVIGGVFGAGLGVLSIPADRRARDAAIIDAAATRMNSLRDVQGRQAILSDSTSRLAAGLEMNPAARVEFERQAAKFQDEIRIQEERDIGRAVEARTVAQRAEIAAARVELEAIPAETPRAVELSKRVMELEDYVQRVDTAYRAQRELVARGVAQDPATRDAPPQPEGTIRYYHGTGSETAADFSGKTFVTPHIEYAADYRGGQGNGRPNNLLYTDLTKQEAIDRGLYDEANDFPINGSIDDGAARLQPLRAPAPPVSPFRRLMINRFMEGGRSGEEGLALAKTFENYYANVAARAGWTPEKMLQEYPLPEVVYRAPERAPEPKAEEGVPVFDDGKPHFYDGPAENAPDGKPLASETEMLFAPPLYQPAYHGSPHIFDRFEWSDKTRGKGEGAQAFGDGLYFAGKKEVAQYYKETLTEDHVGPAKRVLAKADGDVDAAIAATETEIARLAALNLTEASGSSTRDAKMRGRQAELAELTAYRDTGKWRTSGRLYKVDIPHDDELMAWDAPLSEQPPKVREAFNEVAKRAGVTLDDGMTGEQAYRRISGAGAMNMTRKQLNDWYEQEVGYRPDDDAGKELPLAELQDLVGGAMGYRGGDAGASAALRDAGIPGHRFLDQGSRAAGEGTYNYVIYDDSRVNILDYEQAVRDDATLWEPDTGRNADETPRGQIKFKDGKSLMTLFDGADPSTALHEAGHHFLMMIKDMGERTDTGPGIKEDWAQVKGWLAVNAKDVAAEAGNDVTPDDVLAVLNRNTSGDKMKDIAINRGIHEQWARGFEAYHLEGKAPSAGMRGVFESFRKWLAAIYASVKSLNVNLTPEIRQVFDRLLTDEPTVERAVVTAPERPATAMNLDPPQPELPDAPLVEAGARAGKSEDVAGFEEQIGAKVDGTYNEEGDIDMLRSLGRVLPEEEAALKQADDGYKDALAYEKAIQVALACVIS